MQCPICGYESKDNAKFCEKCGTPLSGTASVADSPKPSASSVGAAQKKPDHKVSKIIIPIAVILFIFVGLCTCYTQNVFLPQYEAQQAEKITSEFEQAVREKIQEEIDDIKNGQGIRDTVEALEAEPETKRMFDIAGYDMTEYAQLAYKDLDCIVYSVEVNDDEATVELICYHKDLSDTNATLEERLNAAIDAGEIGSWMSEEEIYKRSLDEMIRIVNETEIVSTPKTVHLTLVGDTWIPDEQLDFDEMIFGKSS